MKDERREGEEGGERGALADVMSHIFLLCNAFLGLLFENSPL